MSVLEKFLLILLRMHSGMLRGLWSGEVGGVDAKFSGVNMIERVFVRQDSCGVSLKKH